MAPQTSYAINIPAVSFPGQIADDSEQKDVLSAAAFAAALAYGILAVRDATNTAGFDGLAAKSPAATGDVSTMGSPLGIVIADQARAQNPAVAIPQYPQFSMVPCMRKGRVWVNAETAMADGASPFVRFSANGALTLLGSFRNDADTTAGPVDHAVQMAAGQAIVRGTTAGAGFAVIELDLV